MTARLRILSLGAGVQSTTLALMAAHGDIDVPDVAIFADTRWEQAVVYEHLQWLMSPNVLPFPVHIVSAGDIREGIRLRRNTTGGRFASIPWWTVNPNGSQGKGRRQCSSEYKLTPIMHEIRRLLGKPGRAYIAPGTVDVLIGISKDEADRESIARQQYMRNVYPLLDMRITREGCYRWLEEHDYPVIRPDDAMRFHVRPWPPKSACIGCPFRDDDGWRLMQLLDEQEWTDAIDADRQLREGNSRGMNAIEFMHQQRVPLAKADLTIDDRQGNLFSHSCSVWHCGT